MLKKISAFLVLANLCLNSFGQNGNALNFDGTDDVVDLNAILLSTTDGFQPYTLEAWVNSTSGVDDCVICQYEGIVVNALVVPGRVAPLLWIRF